MSSVVLTELTQGADHAQAFQCGFTFYKPHPGKQIPVYKLLNASPPTPASYKEQDGKSKRGDQHQSDGSLPITSGTCVRVHPSNRKLACVPTSKLGHRCCAGLLCSSVGPMDSLTLPPGPRGPNTAQGKSLEHKDLKPKLRPISSAICNANTPCQMDYFG